MPIVIILIRQRVVTKTGCLINTVPSFRVLILFQTLVISAVVGTGYWHARCVCICRVTKITFQVTQLILDRKQTAQTGYNSSEGIIGTGESLIAPSIT